MPLGPDVNKNIEELKSAHPDWSRERIIAAAIHAAETAKNKRKKH